MRNSIPGAALAAGAGGVGCAGDWAQAGAGDAASHHAANDAANGVRRTRAAQGNFKGGKSGNRDACC